LLTSVLASLENSFVGCRAVTIRVLAAQYRSLATQSLASAWADAGGVGIARILTNALRKPSLPKTSR